MKPTVYALTGGIASGKSYVCRLLAQRGLPIFSCDEAAQRLMADDEAVRQELIALIGKEAYLPDGKLNKHAISAHLKAQGTARVNEIVHPRVRAAFQAWLDEQTAAVVVMECALLFEAGFDDLADCKVLVSAPEEVRIARLMRRNGIDEQSARAWLALQMPEEEKARRADAVLYNDGQADLIMQIDHLFTAEHFLSSQRRLSP